MKYKIWIWLLLFACSSLTGLSQETVRAELTQQKIIDVCGSADKKEFYVSLSIGEVQRSDSLYGFQYYLNYNPEKIQWITALYTNTLSEFFETREVSFISEEGRVQGYATTFNFSFPPSSGNKPLVVLYGRFLGDCPDTTRLYLEDIEFTEEFKIEVEKQDTLIIEGLEVDKETRAITAGFSSDSLFFRNDSIQKFELYMQYDENIARLDLIEFNLVYDKTYFEILKTETVDDLISNLSVEDIDDGKKIRFQKNNDFSDQTILEFDIKRKSNDSLLSGITIDSINTGFCSCVTRYSSENLYLRSIKKDTTGNDIIEISNKSDTKSWYSASKNCFIIKNEKNLIKFASFYDLMGYKIKEIDNIFENRIEIDVAELLPGIYFGIVVTENNEKKRIVLIKE